MGTESVAALFALMAAASIRILLVAIAVGGILLAARVHSGAVRHAAWCTVLAAMLLMPVLPRWVPSVALPLPAEARRVEAVPTAFQAAWDETADQFAQPRPSATASQPASAAAPVSRLSADTQTTAKWPVVLLAVYVVGLLFLLVRLLAGCLAVRRVVLSATPTAFQESDLRIFGLPAEARTTRAKAGLSDSLTRRLVLESPAVSTPMTVGVLAPKVLLPSAWKTWPREKLQAVLAHELAHVRRHDALVALLARLNLCLFWFNPVAWWLERTLASTAEQACDDAGLRAIGEKRRYAEVLLDMAEAVRRAGGRLSWDGVGVHGTGLLGQRIDRVLRGDLLREVSMTRKVVVALSCAVAIFVVVACRRQAAPAAALKEDPAYVAQQAQNKERVEFERSARDMTAPQVADLEATLQKNPEDLMARKKLLTFALPFGVRVPGEQGKWAPKCAQVIGNDPCITLRRSQILWLIEHHADSDALGDSLGRIPPGGAHLNDAEGYAEAKRLWLAKTASANTSVAVLGNAADFFEYADKPLAEEMLLRAQRTDAKGPWTRRLGRLYAAAIFGVPPFLSSTTYVDEAHGAFAAGARKKLEESRDPQLLTEAGWWLTMNNGGSRTQESLEMAALARTSAERALAIDPQSVQAHAILVSLHQRDLYSRLRAAVGNARGEAEFKAASALPDAQRFEFLPRLAVDAYMSGDYYESIHKDREAKAERDRARKYAEDALTLAPTFRDTDTYGTAIYAGNMVMAGLTFREGDGEKAGRYLIEASKAPANDELRYALPGPGFQLLGFMLKYGVRDPVVEFLDRIGRMNAVQGKYLLQAADQIRKGYRPIYYPRERPYYPGMVRQ